MLYAKDDDILERGFVMIEHPFGPQFCDADSFAVTGFNELVEPGRPFPGRTFDHVFGEILHGCFEDLFAPHPLLHQFRIRRLAPIKPLLHLAKGDVVRIWRPVHHARAALLILTHAIYLIPGNVRYA